MRFCASRVFAAAFAGLLLATVPLIAHHEILGKFDDKKPVTLSGVVTLVIPDPDPNATGGIAPQ